MQPEELQRGLSDLGISLTHDEVTHLRAYFVAKFGANEIRVEQFENILKSKWDLTFVERDAKRSLSDLKQKFSKQSKALE